MRKLDARQRFVIDVVRSAVALPQSDPQDRLRVLTAAAQTVRPVSVLMQREYAREGARLEADLIASGQRPSVSMLASGNVDCTTALQLVELLPLALVPQAEQALVGVITACPRQGLEAVRLKLESALDQGSLAARALLAVADRMGARSVWGQMLFEKFFRALPSDDNAAGQDAPHYAAMFASMAPRVEKGMVGDAGLRLLEWLSKLADNSERNHVANMVLGTMREVLGEAGCDEALRRNVVASGVAASVSTCTDTGIPRAVLDDSVSVLAAMQTRSDRTEALKALPPGRRAREAAALGFVASTRGDSKLAERYLDLAFSAADEVWSARNEITNAPAIIQEVSEAATQVDSVAALTRAQTMSEPAARALSMLAVARVVLGQDFSPAKSRK